MQNLKSRRLAALLAVIGVFAVVATAAVAGPAARMLSNNTTSLPAKNPTDLAASQGKAYAWTILPANMQPDAASPSIWGNAETTGGGLVTVGKMTTDNADNGYVTVTVKSSDTGLILTNAMATISGGQVGAVQIASTTLSKNGTTYTVKLKFPGMQGTLGSLNLKWYTEQLAL